MGRFGFAFQTNPAICRLNNRQFAGRISCKWTRTPCFWNGPHTKQFEVKAARTVHPADTKGLKRLAEQAGTDFQRGIVFYTGESILSLGDENYLAIPLSKLWEL